MTDQHSPINSDQYSSFQGFVLNLMREVTGLSADDLKLTTTFEEINLESLAITAFVSRIEPYFRGVSKKFIFDCRNVDAVCVYLNKHHAQNVREIISGASNSSDTTVARENDEAKENRSPEATGNVERHIIPDIELETDAWPEIKLSELLPEGFKDSNSQAIAIIGMHGRFPQAETLDQFWENLTNSRHAITEIPDKRWSLEGFYEAGSDTRKTGKSYAKWGAFIDNVDQFDPQFFGISAREAAQMDPQERIFLESAWKAMEDAALFGERAESIRSDRGFNVGVFVGLTTNTYSLLTADNWRQGAKDIPAAVPWSSANRVSFALNLNGPSVAVDTACSSSLVAVHQACESIRLGECKAAIAGGVNLYLHPAKYIQLCQLQMLSPTGRCHTYGKDADGFVPGEGVASVVLKSLDDALEDGDQILGVIKGTSVNHSGRTNGYTVPNAQSQASLINSALADFNLNPESITYVEAHGTGTKLGDPIEFTGLTETLAGNTSKQPCGIGSVKSNIGHLESGAGIAGMIKVLLQLRHQKIAPSLWSKELNPALVMDGTRFFVPQETSEWIPDQQTGLRRAGISSFGAGGTNGHVIIEEAPEQSFTPITKEYDQLAFPISARSAVQLEDSLKNLLDRLKNYRDEKRDEFYSLAYTLQCGRQHHPYRCVFLAKDFSDLCQTISRELKNTSTENFTEGYWKSHIRADEEVEQTDNTTEMRAMAQQWVKGIKVIWNQAWPDAPKLFNDLPAYPFDRTSYWISSDASTITLPDQKSVAAQLNKKHFSFTGEEYFLQEHKIDGSPIFPAASFVDYFLRVSRENYPHDDIQLQNITWANPFRPVTGQANEMFCRQTKDENSLSLEFFSAENEKVFCRARAMSVANRFHEQQFSLEQARKQCRRSIDIRSSYALFDSLDMQYGKSFQCMQSAFLSDDQQSALVEVSLQCPREDCDKDMLIEAGQLDGIFQSSIVFSLLDKSNIEKQFIPYSLKALNFSGPLPDQVWVYVKPDQNTNDQWQTFDLTVFDKDGQVLMTIEEFRLRTINIQKQKIRTLNEQESEHRLHTYIPSWQSAPLIHAEGENKDKLILIFDQDEEFKNALSSVNSNDGNTPYLVIPSDQFLIRDDRVVEMDNKNQAHLNLLWRMFKAEAELPTTLIFNLLPNVQKSTDDNNDWEALIGLNTIKPLIGILRSLDEFSHTRFHIQINLLHPIDHSQNTLNASIAGFMRAIHEELPGITVNVVRSIGEVSLNVHNRRFVLDYRFGKREGVQEIKWQNEQRYIKRITLQTQHLLEEADQAILTNNDVVVITGGMGAVASALIDEMSQLSGVRFALLGRSSLNQKIQARLDELSARGVKAAYWSADCSDKSNMAETLERIRTQFGSISAVLHCAGGLKDAYFLKQQANDWEEVLKSKTLGALWLDELTKNDPIKWFAVCAGLAGVRGNIGQSLYGLANAWLDEFIEKRHVDRMTSHRRGISKSIAWSLWDTESGMRPPQTVIERFAKKGLTPIPEAIGASYFKSAINSKTPVVIPIHGARHAITQFLQSHAVADSETVPFKTSSVKETEVISSDEKKESDVDVSVETSREEIRGKEASGMDVHLSSLQNYLAKLISDVTGTDLAKIDPEVSLEAFGLDSILVMEMNELLSQDFPEMSKTVLFEARNLRMLAELLFEEHQDEVSMLFGTPTEVASPVSSIKEEQFGQQADQLVVFSEDQNSESEPERIIDELREGPGSSVFKGQDSPSIEQFSSYTKAQTLNTVITSGSTEEKGDRIAIVGIAGRYPGASNLDELWQHLSQGDDLITEIPGRWETSRTDENGKPLYAKWGGFIDDFDCFDPLFFGISPRDAERMDPQERLFLQTAWHTIEDAGYTPESLSGGRQSQARKRVGVIVGVMYGEYQLYSANNDITDVITNSSYSSIANRVSYCLDFDGPSFAVDSMCSSSLTSVSLACDQLRNGRSDAVIAGGVNLSIHPHKYRMLCELNFASTDGRCRSFGEGGDGYVPGEGVGAVLLKRLEDAERDHDHIYAVIQGTDLGHGAKTSGYTVPNAEAQTDVIQRAFDRAGLDPNKLSYVEAHGTGTSLGDPIEIRGLTKALKAQFDEDKTCPVGSIKSNIGHLESAAGIAALSKVILQIQHQKLAPSIHSDVLNSHIDFSKTPFYVQQELQDWQENMGQPRVAAISSFGAGGSNAHIVMEEYLSNRKAVSSDQLNTEELICLSSRSQKQLVQQVKQLVAYLDSQTYFNKSNDVCEIETASYLSRDYFTHSDVINTLRYGRRQHRVRLSFKSQSFDQLKNALLRVLDVFASFDGKTESELVEQLAHYQFFYKDIESGTSYTGPDLIDDLSQQAMSWINDQLDIQANQITEELNWRKVPLPGYVFLRNRYWVDQKRLSVEKQIERPEAKENVIPLSPKAILDQVSRGEMKHEDAKAYLQALQKQTGRG